ncbi:hypothetical protein FKM82_019714 [Ascaphus truei]
MPLEPVIKLVVTGDDFGYCPRRDQGIVECFRAGALSNVSLLVNGSAAAGAAELAQRYNIPIGLHANLSEGRPVCPELRQNSSLVSARGVFLGKLGIRRALEQGLLSMSENPQQWKVDNQHVHVLPRIRQVFAQILREHGICYTRIPVELGLHECTWVQKELMEFYKGVEEDARNTVDVFKSHGIRWPDIYIGLSTMGRNMSTRNIQRAIDYSLLSLPASLPPGLPRHSPPSTPSVSMELMTHPGYPSLPTEGGCGEGPDDFSRSRERLHELEVLRDPSLQSYYKEHKVQLCAFRDL